MISISSLNSDFNLILYQIANDPLEILKESTHENDTFENRNLEKIKQNVDIMVCYLKSMYAF